MSRLQLFQKAIKDLQDKLMYVQADIHYSYSAAAVAELQFREEQLIQLIELYQAQIEREANAYSNRYR